MLGMAPDYDHLPVINKVEVFEYALDSTSGEDLHKVGLGGGGCLSEGFVMVVCLSVQAHTVVIARVCVGRGGVV
jgi:hypothetical protein